YGFTPMEVVTLRESTAAMMLLIYMSFYAPKQLKLKKWTDICYFIGTGAISIIFFNYSMFKTIELSSISVSASLLYTCPAFVIIVLLKRLRWPLYQVLQHYYQPCLL